MGLLEKIGLAGLFLGSSCVLPSSEVSENFSKPPFYNLSAEGNFYEVDVQRNIILKEFIDEDLGKIMGEQEKNLDFKKKKLKTIKKSRDKFLKNWKIK